MNSKNINKEVDESSLQTRTRRNLTIIPYLQHMKKPYLFWMVVCQMAAVFSFGIWTFIAIFSPMFSDGGVNNTVIAFVAFTVSMPILIFISSIVLWVAYYKQKMILLRICIFFILASLLPAITLI